MVGGLVEHENVLLRIDQFGKCEPSLFAAGKSRDGFEDVFAHEEELGEKASQRAVIGRRRDAPQLLYDLVSRFEAFEILGIVTDVDLRSPMDLSAKFADVAEYRFDKRRFARAVAADYAEGVAA